MRYSTSSILFLSFLAMITLPSPAHSTETLDCVSERYLLRLHIGTTGYFSGVLLYEDDREDYRFVPVEDMKRAELGQTANDLNLEYDSTSPGLPSFNLAVKDGKEGTLLIDGKKLSVECDWPE